MEYILPSHLFALSNGVYGKYSSIYSLWEIFQALHSYPTSIRDSRINQTAKCFSYSIILQEQSHFEWKTLTAAWEHTEIWLQPFMQNQFFVTWSTEEIWHILHKNYLTRWRKCMRFSVLITKITLFRQSYISQVL